MRATNHQLDLTFSMEVSPLSSDTVRCWRLGDNGVWWRWCDCESTMEAASKRMSRQFVAPTAWRGGRGGRKGRKTTTGQTGTVSEIPLPFLLKSSQLAFLNDFSSHTQAQQAHTFSNQLLPVSTKSTTIFIFVTQQQLTGQFSNVLSLAWPALEIERREEFK